MRRERRGGGEKKGRNSIFKLARRRGRCRLFCVAEARKAQQNKMSTNHCGIHDRKSCDCVSHQQQQRMNVFLKSRESYQNVSTRQKATRNEMPIRTAVSNATCATPWWFFPVFFFLMANAERSWEENWTWSKE